MSKKISHIPDLGKLSVAIIESRVKALVGDEAIKVLRKSYDEEQLQNTLAEALSETERRFREEHVDKELARAILELPIANLPSVRDAVRSFYDHPADPAFANLLKNQLATDYPNVESGRIHAALTKYLTVLREELVSVDDEIRQKLIAISLLGIQKTMEEFAEGEKLYRKFSQASLLSQHIRVREFQTLVNERTKSFIGREFIFKAVDDLTQGSRFSSGYIIIHGEPGIGKTSLISQLVRTRGYIHHFNIASQNIRSVRDFLSNLCAQIIVKYELEHSFLPENATRDSGFLVQVLSEAVEKEPSHRIIILIDALDEVDDLGLHPNVNKLYLPPALPSGVFFVITAREKAGSEYRFSVDNLKDIYLRDTDPLNLEDVSKYIEEYITQYKDKMSIRIAQWKIKQAEFVDVITEKSQGNFMYLVYVLQDIRDGSLTVKNVDNIRNLPIGLKEYYRRHWRMMRDRNKERFEKYQMPVICILATVREPVTMEMVSEWTKLSLVDIKDVIDEWREFLNDEPRAGGESWYHLYHPSFQDFLKEEVGLTKYHGMIALTALRKIPGFLDGRTEE